ncbi:TCTP family protein [Histoplasma capsulatum var. duboisii H88]|uniref:Translationally-controlled tumor protein homolog n=2 Tax=Ajellomyces capsulatus TaxID=5037 RepID=F0UF50_AJEC8|nr:TCTP family protein [Histoplasma capsulatum H143]EGC44062.1 TCTP family protein [Histoplasma capsulatum var. duboisii H88]QSS54853.1 TCTP family protein [Histoplasma capsulatum var. duboisii H88]
MIVYKDIVSGDEIISDTWKLIETPGGVLWECDCKKYARGAEKFQLEGANPSAEEGGEEDYSGEGGGEMVHDIEVSFQLNWLKPDENGQETKPSKEQFKAHLKSYVKKVNNALKERGASEETIKEFQAGAPAAVKKILANYDNYDVLMGSSMNGDGMHVLIDFREDGITPFATVWKHGLVPEKV